ncbi:uncharacterized protein LOC124436830 [Xenia sp. Carnegie-2017]|uniref:uncharacterized protein LOC124436830 n=1 Tax=Xenia sp. Carnegie-2017 TaxID=2897299 RepID=UPI001F04D0A7|nr:uncharacterized protein LOC124436830 [Xenia sp. Carnegie-2017]
MVSRVDDYETKISILIFFKQHLMKLEQMDKLDEELDKKWRKTINPPLDFERGIANLLGEVKSCNATRNKIRCCFSKGVAFLKKSCFEDDVTLASFKLLFLTEEYYSKFKNRLIDDEQILNIEPLSSGKFQALDRSRRR